MSPLIHHISSDETLPKSADVVVIGGGIVGASAAYFLARRGLSVALIEKGYVGCEQSSRNWGWCRRQNRDARELPLANLALRLWEELTEEIGHDLGFRRCGLIYATADPKQLAEWDKWRAVARRFDVKTRMLTADEATAAVPAAGGRKWLGGVHAADDGKAEPWLAAPRIAEGARKHGATIHQNCAARGLDITNGQVSGVVTEKGLIRTSAVLCAAGAWASAFLRMHAVSMPLASVRQTALRTGPAPDFGEAVFTPDFAMTRRLDGSYTIAVSGRATLEITPQGIRYVRPFLPMFMKRLKAVEIGIGRSFFEGPDSMRRWHLDKPTPFERIRPRSGARPADAGDHQDPGQSDVPQRCRCRRRVHLGRVYRFHTGRGAGDFPGGQHRRHVRRRRLFRTRLRRRPRVGPSGGGSGRRWRGMRRSDSVPHVALHGQIEN
ncbi:putative Sarcosine oxidase [Mesorhizobium delmotii]|uniref:Putative Sarcosine oxidase n=1 Tax=Mesorhizobium delmotii TaxID=1631247 RepID=A0A2P9AA98_9HYPH|nr:putative Sarcosine oxidase [Mesorhizobium delmotii]